jgi:hypothetical protein
VPTPPARVPNTARPPIGILIGIVKEARDLLARKLVKFPLKRASDGKDMSRGWGSQAIELGHGQFLDEESRLLTLRLWTNHGHRHRPRAVASSTKRLFALIAADLEPHGLRELWDTAPDVERDALMHEFPTTLPEWWLYQQAERCAIR